MPVDNQIIAGNKKAAGVFCTLEDGMTPAAFFDCAPEGIARLQEPVRNSLAQVCRQYYGQTGETLRITSGWRSLRHCAELMAGFDRQQLEGMYCRNGYPSYVRKLLERREQLGRQLTGDEAYEVLANRTEGYISWHLQGGAADILAPVAQPDLLKKLLQECGFRVLDEQDMGISCYHATLTGLEPRIVRE